MFMGIEHRIAQIFVLCLVLYPFLFHCYPKWEYLSWQHAHEFVDPIVTGIDEGCLTEYPKSVRHIKVITYDEREAKVWFKGMSDSTWLATFRREGEGYEWTALGRSICHIEIINSNMGGSADDIYWYN
ncbi:MAG: hypothetical protein AAF639_04270 [Chloroflexota bacterium]